MNLHQFRFVQEAARRNLNLTETAKALFTSQPGSQSHPGAGRVNSASTSSRATASGRQHHRARQRVLASIEIIPRGRQPEAP